MKGPAQKWSERGFMGLLALTAVTPYVILVGLFSYLTITSLPVFRYMGVRFFTRLTWTLGNLYAAHPVTVHAVRVMPGAEFGGAVFFVGTALTSAGAIIVATPLSLFLASASSFSVPRPWRNVLALLVEMMAGVPSVIFGLFGFTVLGPIIVARVGPWLNHWLSPIPFISGPIGSDTNLLTAVIVLTLMIIPIVATTTRLGMDRVPPELVDSARALGWTEFEVFWHVVWPNSQTALMGGVILGLGRALGETMAVLMVSGNALNVLPSNIYSGISTIAATIAGQLDAALTDPTGMAVHALGALGLVLMIITLIVNLLARRFVGAGPGSRVVGRSRK